MPRSSARSELSRSIEDYLKVIYKLERESGSAQTSAIAEALSIAPPSVSGMVKRLADNGLVTHTPYRGVELTETGRSQALKMLRRHRVLESYLIENLGYDWDDVHQEAERLEHAVSDELIERMASNLGNPTHDPHGAPIPSASGQIEPLRYIPMTEIDVGATAMFRLVGDADSKRLRFIASLGLKPGVEFRVLARQPFNGPVTVQLPGDRQEVIGFELASSLKCEQLATETS